MVGIDAGLEPPEGFYAGIFDVDAFEEMVRAWICDVCGFGFLDERAAIAHRANYPLGDDRPPGAPPDRREGNEPAGGSAPTERKVEGGIL